MNKVSDRVAAIYDIKQGSNTSRILFTAHDANCDSIAQ